MKTLLRSLVPVLLGSASLAPAQFGSGRGYFFCYPDFANPATCTEFVGRSLLGSGGGEILLGGLGTFAKGFGDVALGGHRLGYFSAFQAWMQDRDPATVDMFRFVVRKSEATDQWPDPTPAGVVYQSQWLPSRNTSALSLYQFALGAPVAYELSKKHWFGVELQAVSNPTAGLGVATAHNVLGTRGDNGRAGVRPDNYVVTNGSVQMKTDLASIAIAIGSGAPSCVMGGVNPANTRQPAGAINFGLGGSRPDVSGRNGSGRADNLAVGLWGFGSASGNDIAMFALSFDEAPSPFRFPNFSGQFYLLPTNLILIGPVTVPQSGHVAVVIPLGPPDNFTRLYLATNILRGQAMLLNLLASSLRFTNMGYWDTTT